MTATSLSPTFRPLGFGELLDQAIRLYRRNFVKFIGIIALIQVPLVLAQTAVSVFTTRNMFTSMMDTSSDPADVFGPLGLQYAVLAIFGLLSLVLVQGLANGALTRVIADERLGQTTGILESYRKITPVLPRLIAALLLFVLALLGLLIWALVPCIGWISGAGMLIFLSLAIGPIIAPIVVVEHAGATQALRRAWELTRRRFWWVMGFMAVLIAFSYLIVAGPSMIVGAVLTGMLGTATDMAQMNTITTLANSLTALVTGLLYQPLQLTAVTLLYFDLRIRNEGLDLAIEAQRDSGQALDLAQISAEAPAASGESILTGKEFGYFVLLSMGLVALWAALFGVLMLISFLFVALLGGM